MIENVVIFPYDDDVIYAMDSEGENVYIRIIAFFDFKGEKYNVYQYTTEDKYAYIGMISDTSENKFSSTPVTDDDQFEPIRDAWNEYAQGDFDFIDVESED